MRAIRQPVSRRRLHAATLAQARLTAAAALVLAHTASGGSGPTEAPWSSVAAPGIRRAALEPQSPLFVSRSWRLPFNPADAQVDAHWSSAVSGNWMDGGRWSTNPVAPNNGGGTTYRAYLDAVGAAHTITLNSSVSLDLLRVSSGSATLHHTAGVLTPTAAEVASGTYRLDGGTLRNATLSVTGGSFEATTSAGNVLDNVSIIGNLKPAGLFGTLTVRNGLSIAGTLELWGDASRVLSFDGSQTLSGGNVQFTGLGQAVRLGVEGDSTLTIAAGTTLRGGWGAIGEHTATPGSNAVVNNGVIRANVSGQPLRVTSDSFTNNGTAEAAGGGRLEILAGQWANAGTMNANAATLTFGGDWSNAGVINVVGGTLNLGGTFSASDAGTINRSGLSVVNLTGTLANAGGTLALNATTGNWVLTGGQIQGGTVTQSGGALLIGSGESNRLDGVTVVGDLNLLSSYAQLRVTNGLNVSGAVRVGSQATLRLEGVQTIDDGDLRFEGNNGTINFGDMVTLGPATTITNTASGNFDMGPAAFEKSLLINQGLIKMTGSGANLDLSVPKFQNEGTVEASSGARVRIGYNSGQSAVEWTNIGTLRVNNGTLLLDGVMLAGNGIGTLERTGGTIGVQGTVDLQGGSITLDSLTGSWELVGGGFRDGTVNLTQGAGLLFNSIPNVTPYRGGRLENVTLNGNLTLGDGPMNYEPGLSVYGGLGLNGTISLTGQNTKMIFWDDQELSSGTIALGGLQPTGLPFVGIGPTSSSGAATLTIRSGAAIRGGNGIIGKWGGAGGSAGIINEGTISADIELVPLHIEVTNLENRGTLEAVNAGILKVYASNLWLNNGLVRVSGGTLNMWGNVKFGPQSTFQRSGGTVNLYGTLLNAGETLTLNNASGSWRALGATILGGTVNVQGSAQLVLASDSNGTGATLSGVTFNGNMSQGGGLTVRDGFTLNGTINVTGTIRVGFPGPSASQTVTGGTFYFPGTSGSNTDLIIASNGTQTLSPTTVVHGGRGRIGYQFGPNWQTSVLRNKGLISADQPGKEIVIQTGKLVNEGTIEAVNGAYMRIHSDTTWANTGLIRVASGGFLELSGNSKTADLGQIQDQGGTVWFRTALNNTGGHLILDGSTGSWDFGGDALIKGGQVSQLQGSRLNFSGGGTLEGVTFNHDVYLGTGVSGPSQVRVRNGLNVNGTVHLTQPANTLTFDGDQPFGPGTISMETLTGERTRVVADNNSTLTFATTATVRGGRGDVFTSGSGTVINRGLISADVAGQSIDVYTARFQNYGTVQAVNGGVINYIPPPPLHAPPTPSTFYNEGVLRLAADGALATGADYVQTATGTMRIEIAGIDQYGRADFGNHVFLDGLLSLALAGGYMPVGGESFQVWDLNASAVFGEFSSFQLPALAGGLSWNLGGLYEHGVVSVVPSPGPAGLLALGLVWAMRRRGRTS